MSEQTLLPYLICCWLGLAAVTFVSLFFFTAPYGRHTREGFGGRMDRRLGWMLMELPAAVVFGAFYILGGTPTDPASVVFLIMWEVHYVHRSVVFPFRMRGGRKNITLLTVLLAIVFNSVNGYINGRYLFGLGPGYPSTWLTDPRFICGALLFVVGAAINQHSDLILFRLRRDTADGYAIPHGGLYRYVSCPNYLGEILEWIGWAVATWSLAGLSFALWTCANLVPRARANHIWYLNQFKDYPPDRKAVVPYLF